MSATPIQLVVGLKNPGSRYAATRHNAGGWLLDLLAQQYNEPLREETKFCCNIARIAVNDHHCWIATPNTYMNHSGQAIAAIMNYYKIAPEALLVVHDEVDFPPGAIKFKQSGGHGGHNGIRDVINHLHSNHFHRLRIGVGHPGNAEDVPDYVLHEPSRTHRVLIDQAINKALHVIPEYIAGDQQKAIRELHNG